MLASRHPKRFWLRGRRHIGSFLAMTIAVCVAATAAAQEAPEPDSSKWLEQFAKYKIRCGEDPSGGSLKLVQAPLLAWTNPTDFDMTGATFLWTCGGRPCIVTSGFEFDIRNERRVKHTFHSLSSEPVSISSDGQEIWKTDSPGIEWKSLPENAIGRGLAALRRAARQFRVEMTSHRDQKYKLRLMPAPLFQYSSADKDIIHGAIFAFANGNDPDALVLMELFKADGQQRIRYAFARSHYYQLEASLGEKSVWNAELDISQQNIYQKGSRLPISSTYLSLIVHSEDIVPGQ